MATKWTASAKLDLAIAKLEEQQPDNALTQYGTNEHLAIVRYLVHECLDANGKLDKAMLKAEFKAMDTFLGYASNAKKLLIERGTLPASAAKPDGGYE